MLRAKGGGSFFSNRLCNRNTVEFLGIWEQLNNPNSNCAEFDKIKSQAGLLICFRKTYMGKEYMKRWITHFKEYNQS